MRPISYSLLLGLAAALTAAAGPAAPDFRDEFGQPVEFAAFLGRPVVATMAYAACRRACPATVSTLKQLQKVTVAQGEIIEFVVVGFDPALDDPQAWRDYRASHRIEGVHWHFLTGTPDSTRRFGRRFGFRYWRLDEHVMHEQRVVVLNDRGRFVGSDEKLSLDHLLGMLHGAGKTKERGS